MQLDVARAGDCRVKRTIYPPRFRWSKDMKPVTGTELSPMHSVMIEFDFERDTHLAGRVGPEMGIRGFRESERRGRSANPRSGGPGQAGGSAAHPPASILPVPGGTVRRGPHGNGHLVIRRAGQGAAGKAPREHTWRGLIRLTVRRPRGGIEYRFRRQKSLIKRAT